MEVDKAEVVDEETDKVVGELLDMVGEMMAGRLTMVKEVATGHAQAFSSPTFFVLNLSLAYRVNL